MPSLNKQVPATATSASILKKKKKKTVFLGEPQAVRCRSQDGIGRGRRQLLPFGPYNIEKFNRTE